MDAVLEEALASVDDDKRAKLLAKATEIGVGEDVGIIPLHYQVNTWAAKKRSDLCCNGPMSGLSRWVSHRSKYR